jgi:hypothetical protein
LQLAQTLELGVLLADAGCGSRRHRELMLLSLLQCSWWL